ncbi:MAG: 23S rRNA (adenine(2503)-C(2))-methyltransferase RlmN [Clostridia bacterium]|nr:23S rRNA (adenine(2503)-C(2))-methyltransferase RlmN [Clostridia bacterium]
MKEDILSKSIDELKELLVKLNQPKYRAEQIFYELQNGKTLDEITTISKELIAKLGESFEDKPVQIETVKKSTDGTQKFLFKLADGNIIEGVLMSYKFGHTLCVSTQVGCRMGCKFCASGLDGLVRNLTGGEIMAQVIVANKHLLGDIKERKVTNIVLMGSGEPLDNYDNIMKFLALATDKHGLYFSERNISLSTCGLVDKIYELADSGRQINLCLSLHAPNDTVRSEIMPISKAYKMNDLLSACKYYFEKTNRRILFEYIMINNVNSKKEHALELAKKLSKLNCIVNLINLNEVKENNFKSCKPEVIDNFAKVLKSYGINVTTRRSLGGDIDGACGQLRRKFIKKEEEK